MAGSLSTWDRGSTYDLGCGGGPEDVERTGATLPPFDDLRTIAGQGTIAVEVLASFEDERPGGGPGGWRRCIAGITTYLAERDDHRGAAAGAAAMTAARRRAGDAGPVRRRRRGEPGGHADLCRASAAGDMVPLTTVDEGAVCTAMLDLYQERGHRRTGRCPSHAGLLEADIEPGPLWCAWISGNNDVPVTEVLSARWSTWASSTISWSTSAGARLKRHEKRN